jgi:hypothetical protein
VAERVRPEPALVYIDSDLPAGMTIAEFRGLRAASRHRRWRRLRRLWRRFWS